MLYRFMVALIIGFLAAGAQAQETALLKTPNDRMSYAIGADMGRNLRQQGIVADIDHLIKGFQDFSSGEKLLFTEKELQVAITTLHLDLGWKGSETKKVSLPASYGMGIDAARKVKIYDIKINADLFRRGLADLLSGNPLLLTEKDLRSALASFQFNVKQNQSKLSRLARDTKRGEETAFFSENKRKEGVISLPSGLQYKVLKSGEGKTFKDGDTVEVHYRGTFLDGTEFANTYAGGRPVVFKAPAGIPGLSEALKRMPPGSKWQVFVPSKLAYRSRGWGISGWPTFPLIFELEVAAVR